MKFLKLSAALAVASCFLINSIAQATVKEEHELSGAKPTVKTEKVVSKSKVPSKIEKKLSNEGFVAKAPEKVVAAQRESQEKYKAKIAMLQESLAKLQ